MNNNRRRVRWCMGSLLMLLALCSTAQMVADEAIPTQADSSARGITVEPLVRTGYVEDEPGSISAGRLGTGRRDFRRSRLGGAMEDSGWVLIDTDTFLVYVPVGEACAIRFVESGDSLMIMPPPDPLTPLAKQAIDYAPDWTGLDLKDLFARLDSIGQDTYAAIILGTVDPYVDEIAFVIAHTAPEVLGSANFYPGLLTENVEDVYAHDPYLDYADIVDYGSAVAGGAYYSTVVYRTAEIGDTVEIELPRDRYYWDIVHPKITDEFPTYIDPATGYASAPPTGRFWREFLFTHADSGFPVLKDELAGCQVLWEGNVDSKTNGAIGIMTQWILDVMDFGSGVERPIQPVRVYRKHLGRCGEHADITCAAARAALIPTNSPLAMASDHTWNEFYDQRWVHWEPVNVYVDSPWHYEGWGKEFIGIFNWRGDDWIWTVTERYTPYCTLSVAVTDSFGYPIDGAQVTVARKISTVTFYEATWTSTDHNGECRFLVGDNNDIFVRIESGLGTYPAGPLYKKAIAASVPDTHYTWSRMLPNPRPQLPINPAVPPPGAADQYRLRVDWEVESEFTYGQNRLDDKTYSEEMTGGAVAFFICDETNYSAYAAADSFYAYEILEDANSADVAFTLPTFESWYAVLSNQEHVVNTQVIRGTAELYQRPQGYVADDMLRGRVSLAPSRPNPFGPETEIRFRLRSDTWMDLSVYDVTGRRIATLASGLARAGDHRAAWNGTDSRGRRVAPGVYLYRLDTPEARLSHKMVLLK